MWYTYGGEIWQFVTTFCALQESTIRLLMQHLTYVLFVVIRWHKIPAEVLKQGFHDPIKLGNSLSWQRQFISLLTYATEYQICERLFLYHHWYRWHRWPKMVDPKYYLVFNCRYGHVGQVIKISSLCYLIELDEIYLMM